MRRHLQIMSIFVLSVGLVIHLPSLALAQNRVRAKIGIQIQSGNSVIRAKAKHRLHAGDKLRLYVMPEDQAYVYVVHTDVQSVTLLNLQQAQIPLQPGDVVILPSLQAFYQLDGKSKTESFTIICSPNPMDELLGLLQSDEVPYSTWSALEKKLIKKSKIDLGDKTEKPFDIAGDVRKGPTVEDPFLQELRVYSGKALVVKKYDFRVKK